MTSNDHTEVANALVATSMLITTEMIPAVIGPVANLLSHKREFVRKRALLALLPAGQDEHLAPVRRHLQAAVRP